MTDRGGVSRRDFLRLGLAAGPASLVAACGWDGGRGPGARTARRSAGSTTGWARRSFSPAPGWRRSIRSRPGRRSGTSPPTRSPGTRSGPTPSLLPAGSWRWAGLVRAPKRLTLEMLEGLPRVTYTVKHHCVEGWTAIGTWTGVPVSVVAELVRPLPEARYLRFDSFDSGYSNGWDLASAMHPQTILAYAYNDRPLTPRARRAAAALLARQARLQADQVRHRDDASPASGTAGTGRIRAIPGSRESSLLLPAGLTLGLLAARAAAAPPLSDPLGRPLPPDLHLSHPILVPGAVPGLFPVGRRRDAQHEPAPGIPDRAGPAVPRLPGPAPDPPPPAQPAGGAAGRWWPRSSRWRRSSRAA